MRLTRDQMMKSGHHPVSLDEVHSSCDFINHHHHQNDKIEEEEEDKISKRWYLIVIALLYIGKMIKSKYVQCVPKKGLLKAIKGHRRSLKVMDGLQDLGL